MSKQIISAKKGVNQRLDKFLSDNISGLSRSTIKKMITEGMVFVNGELSKPSFKLEGKEKISYDIFEKKENFDHLIPQKIDLNILYEDKDIIAIDKPAGLTVHPGAGQKNNTLANALVFHCRELSDINGPIRPGIVHRLDKDTSGVMLVAKNNEAHASLSRQFEKREIDKEYSAITWGKFENLNGEISLFIARSKKDPTSYIASRNGKKALTFYSSKPLGGYASEVVFKPKTGRTHQIRVHSSTIGNPIFGDTKYGGGINRSRGYLPEVSKKLNNLLKNINRHALHAKSITFSHPVSKKMKTISAEMPKDFENIKYDLSRLHV